MDSIHHDLNNNFSQMENDIRFQNIEINENSHEESSNTNKSSINDHSSNSYSNKMSESVIKGNNHSINNNSFTMRAQDSHDIQFQKFTKSDDENSSSSSSSEFDTNSSNSNSNILKYKTQNKSESDLNLNPNFNNNKNTKNDEKNISFTQKLSDMNIKILFIQMEFCEGKTLKEVCSESDISHSNLIKEYFMQMISALNYLHKNDLIHRDLKPANIFLDKHGNIKLGDFGLARKIKEKEENHQISSKCSHDDSNDMSINIGTPFYMAPEQKTSSDYDSKVDMYSLGLILFELLMSPSKTKVERVKVII